MLKEDPKSTTAISQPHNLDEFRYKSYEELSKEFQEACLAAARAIVLIPQMYDRLTLIDGLTHKEAIAKIRNDHGHVQGFSPRNIRRYLPANNANIPRRVRTSCPKNSVTKTCVETSFSDTEHNNENINHNIGRESISSDRTIQMEGVTSTRQDLGECPSCQEPKEAPRSTTNLSTVDTIHTAANNSDKADLKTTSEVLNELSLPSRELHRYVASQRKKGKNEVWLTIKTNASTGKIVYVKTGRNSELPGRNSFEVKYD